MIFFFKKNKLTFERVTCETYPGSTIVELHCGIKYIDRNRNLKIDSWLNISKSLDDVWIHAVPYYRYNTYQRIANELWEQPCEWFSGQSKSYVLDWTIGRMLRYTNFNHTCPYFGRVYFKVDNISIDSFPLPPIMPAGRYRVDIDVVGSNRKNVLASAKFYSSISDHRIEVV